MPLAMPFRTGQFHRKFCDLSYLLLKTFSVESFNFLFNACLFVSYVYLKYLVSGGLKDFAYENSQ